MGVVDTLVNSAIAVVAGLIGVGLLFGGAQQAAYGSQTAGTIVAFIGIVLIVFATRL